MYTVPPTLPSMSDTKPSNNVHFQPIDPAHKSPVQTMDQSLLNSSLNLLDDSPRLQSTSSNGSIPCGQTTPQGSLHASNSPIHAPLPHASQLNVPPTPYVTKRLQTSTWEHNPFRSHLGSAPAPQICSHQQRCFRHRCQVIFSHSDCLLLMHSQHLLKILL